MDKLSHVNDSGQANMVDVAAKIAGERVACASARIRLTEKIASAIKNNSLAKGDVLSVARVAGIMAAKKTDQLIPLCHTLPIETVKIDFRLFEQEQYLHVYSLAKTTAKTGVEMEALAAASVAALTVYDMCKALDKGMVIENIRLDGKSGGKSGLWLRENAGVGVVKAVCSSEKKHVAKQAVDKGELRVDWGLVDDAHASSDAGKRQVSLLAIESYKKQFPDKKDVVYGTFAENITTEGIELYSLPLTTKVLIGDSELEVSQIGKVCHQHCAIYHQTGDCVMPREGIFVKVLNGGVIKPGDIIRCLTIVK